MQKLEILKLLVQAGGDPNVKDSTGNTPLHFAAADGRAFDRNSPKAATLAYLISKGGDASVKNNSGKTPLDLATEANDRIAEEILKGSGTPPTTR